MHKSHEEILSQRMTGVGALVLLLMSVACFIVMLWAIMAVVRLVVGLTL